MLSRMLAITALGAIAIIGMPDGAFAKSNPPKSKIIITTPVVIIGKAYGVAAPMVPGSGGQGSGTIHCDSHNRCSVGLN
jgi:hypothetical protein